MLKAAGPSRAFFHPELAKAREFAKWVESSWPKESSPFTRSHKREHAHSRFICYYIMRELWGMPYRYIEETFRRDHSTIISGISRMKQISGLVEKAKEVEAEFVKAGATRAPTV